MSQSAGPAGGSVSLDHLIALNDELASLARAGLPLESSLAEIADDIPGQLGDSMKRLAERMSRGVGLADALAAEGDQFPRVYRAVVQAGLKSGRLSAALESLASFARHYAEMRRAIGLAMLYPLLVLLLAYGLGLVFLLEVVPSFLTTYESFRLPVRDVLAVLASLRDGAVYWGPVLPAALVLMGCYWVRSGRAASLGSNRVGGILGLSPWARKMIAHSKAAGFAELLALLVDQNVPLPEALALAAEATGQPAMIAEAAQIAAAVQRGESLKQSLRGRTAGLPLLRWLMAAGQQQGTLAPALRHAANTYRRQAAHQADLSQVLMPVLALLVVGATATMFFALTLFLPFTLLLKHLAGE